MATCDDLRLGGTLSPTGITGGVSINDAGITVDDWSALFGSAGISGAMQTINGRWGGSVSGDRLGRERYPILSMLITGRTSICPPVGSREERLQENTDTFMQLLTDPNGNYIEVDMPDGTTRFLHVVNLDPADFNQPSYLRRMAAPLASEMAYWKEGGNQGSQVISGGDTIVVGGNREVGDAVLVFSGDGSFTCTTPGGETWTLTVSGSGSAVTVDLGARTVMESGSHGLNLLRRIPAVGKGKIWGWFEPGSNTVTSTVSVTVTWRDSWA